MPTTVSHHLRLTPRGIHQSLTISDLIFKERKFVFIDQVLPSVTNDFLFHFLLSFLHYLLFISFFLLLFISYFLSLTSIFTFFFFGEIRNLTTFCLLPLVNNGFSLSSFFLCSLSFLWIGAQFPQVKFLSYGRILTLHYYFLLMCILFFIKTAF